MPGSLSLGLNLVSLIVFVLPGLAGVKLGLLIADRADWLNRVDTIALSFGISLVSMGWLYAWISLLSSRPLTTDEVSLVLETLPLGIGLYLYVVAASLLAGLLLGAFNFGGDSVAKRKGLWYKFFSEIESELDDEKYQLRVRMQSGDELRGRVDDKGEISINRDIVLENPLRIIRSEDGSVGDTYRFTGKAYLHNQDISHIEFDRLKTADKFAKTGPETDREGDGAKTDKDDSEMEELETLAKEAEAEDGETGDGESEDDADGNQSASASERTT